METLPNPKVLARIVARLTHGHVEPPVLTGGWFISENMGQWWTHKEGEGESFVRPHDTLAEAFRRAGALEEATAVDWAEEMAKPHCVRVYLCDKFPCGVLELVPMLHETQAGHHIPMTEIHLNPKDRKKVCARWEAESKKKYPVGGGTQGSSPLTHLWGLEIINNPDLPRGHIRLVGGGGGLVPITATILHRGQKYKSGKGK